MRRLIITFLIRRRLKLKKGEMFQFENQKNKSEWYYFTNTGVMKQFYNPYTDKNGVRSSNVSLRWLLDDRCKIIKKEV